MSSIIYKIVARDLWKKALEKGGFEGVGFDISEGFIPFPDSYKSLIVG